VPGTRHFKFMVRSGDWKYIWMANGGREQLFNVKEDPNELTFNVVTTQRRWRKNCALLPLQN
jgi:hypothetical protein